MSTASSLMSLSFLSVVLLQIAFARNVVSYFLIRKDFLKRQLNIFLVKFRYKSEPSLAY